MKNQTLFMTSLLTNLILISAVFFLYFGKHNFIENKTNIESSFVATKQIAIMMPISHPSLEKIASGFCDTLNKSKKFKYQFKTYNANGNNILMRSQVEEVLSQNYDLIFSIATSTTQLLQEVAIKQGNKTPIVSAACISSVIDQARANITCVSDDVPLEQEIEIFKFLKPNLNNILLIYNSSSPGLEAEKEKLETILKSRNISLKTVSVFKTNEISQKVPSFITPETDAVLLLKDNIVVSGIDLIIKLCNQNHVTLLVSDLDSVDKGAVLGFGIYEYDTGVASAADALSIFENNKKSSEIPVKIVNDCKVKLNLNSLTSQNLNLDKNILFLISSGEAVK